MRCQGSSTFPASSSATTGLRSPCRTRFRSCPLPSEPIFFFCLMKLLNILIKFVVPGIFSIFLSPFPRQKAQDLLSWQQNAWIIILHSWIFYHNFFFHLPQILITSGIARWASPIGSERSLPEIGVGVPRGKLSECEENEPLPRGAAATTEQTVAAPGWKQKKEEDEARTRK